MRRWAGTAAAVIAAMSLGRMITDSVPLNHSDDRPFVHAGVVGRSVHLEYADVQVTGVRAARGLDGAETVLAGGVFLIADIEIVARHRPTTFLGINLVDAQGRVHVPTNRGSTCTTSTTAPTGATWHLMACFDVTERTLVGSRLLLARGDYRTDGSGQRRDDVAEIDLGIDRAEAAEMFATTAYYEAGPAGFEPIDTEPLEPPAGEER